MKIARATGRRKTAVAQVRLIPGTGKFVVNKKEFPDYFPGTAFKEFCYEPLIKTQSEGKFDIYATVSGGGKSGQTGAVQLGLSRALVEYEPENKEALRDAGLLTRDSRMVERKKYGQKKARKRFQFSKR